MIMKCFLLFLKDIGRCLYNRWMTSLFIVIFLVVGLWESHLVGANTYPRNIIIPNKVVDIKVDSLINKKQADSLIALYNDLTKRVVEAEEIVRNYQGDSNLVIQKADERVGQWLTISTVLVTIIIGLSVWNNYKYETSIKEGIEKVRRDLECTAQINKIGSIMTCLNSLPDPLLSDSETDRKKYVKKNISMMYEEFAKYVKIMLDKNNKSTKDCDYTQLVLSVLKIAILRVQGVFSDVTSNFSFYTFSSAIDKEIRDLQCGKIANANLNDMMKDILGQFETFKQGLPDNV